MVTILEKITPRPIPDLVIQTSGYRVLGIELGFPHTMSSSFHDVFSFLLQVGLALLIFMGLGT